MRLGLFLLNIFFLITLSLTWGGEKEKVLLNFQEVDIKTLAEYMSEISGKNIVVDPSVRGKVSVELSEPISVKEAWDLFSLLLLANGYAIVDKGEFALIVPANKGVLSTGFKEKVARGEIAVFAKRLKNVEVNAVINTVRPFLSPFARVSAHQASNTIVIADVGENIEKAKKLLSILDSEKASPSFEVFHLKNIPAQEASRLISSLNQIFTRRFGMPTVVSFSQETNTLLVAGPKEAVQVAKELIRKVDSLDLPKVSERAFYLIPLKFVSAEEMAEVLGNLFGKGIKAQSTHRRQQPTQRTQNRKTVSKGKGQKQAKTKPQRKSPQPIPVITTKEGLRIGFDRGTNSIILYATKAEYESFLKLIEQIDKRRKQVLIAATVVEASTKSLLDIGVRWQVLGKRGGAAFGGSSINDVYNAFVSGNFLMGVFSPSGTQVEVGGTTLLFPDLVFLFSLLESGSGFNIISNPKVLTLDNQPAVIKVGQVIPYAEGVKFDINGQPIITYDYKEVGLSLDVTPRISGNNLRLSISLNLEEIVDFVTNQIGSTSYTVPVTSNREINSEVVVENGQTVILGGLVSTKTLKTIEGVPGLSKVPLLGRLFRRDFKQDDKTSLFIFITPYIVSSPEELAEITRAHKEISDKLIERLKEKPKKEEKSKVEVSEEEDEEDFYF